jgi:Rrf2 family protein
MYEEVRFVMISQTTDYALRALVYLTENRSRSPILASEIARKAGIPKNYLSKLLHGLKRAGYLDANRGKTGGYRLAVDPQQISLADILAHFEGRNALQGCFIGRTACRREQPCGAHKRWGPVAVQLRDFLDKTTLAEIAG